MGKHLTGQARRANEAGSRLPRAVAASTVTIALAVLALVVFLAPVAPAQAASRYAPTIRDGRAAARQLLEDTGAPSLSLALVSNGRVVWRQGFGHADKATQTRPGPATMYGLGSVSKMLATVAVMQLVDDGLVSLDEPFATYVPGFRMQSPGYRQITVRMLLDHSSGFPGSAYGSAMTPEYWPGYLDLVMQTLAQSRLKHTPGLLSTYCNDGFTMVEELVPAVTGKSFPRYVQDEIFTPLGMTHSAYPLEAFTDGSYAKAYDDEGNARPREVLNVLASGGTYSTPTDMARFATMLMYGGAYGGTRILSAGAVAEMGVDQTVGQLDAATYNGARYGLGWDSVTQPGLKKVGVTAWMKGGDSVDYHAGLVVVPGKKLAAIVTGVAPINSGKAEALCERILLHALVDRGSLRRMPAQIPAAAPPAKKATQTQLARMQGYWAGNGMVLKLGASAADPQSLTAYMLTQSGWMTFTKGLRLRTDGGFHAKGNANSLRTTTAGNRRYLIDRMVGGYGHYRDNMPLAQKLHPNEPLSAAWASRVDSLWVAVNEHPDSALFTDDGGPLLWTGDVPGLSGYITVLNASYGLQVVDPSESDDAALMFLQIPGFGSRDLNDAVVEERDGQDWLWYGSTLYRPLDGVPALAQGPNTVTTGPEGYAEWRGLAEAARVTITTGATWRLYGAAMQVLASGTSFPATLDAPAGAYLCLFAPAGSGATVTVTPANAGQGGPAADGPAKAAEPHSLAIPVREPVLGTPMH